MNKIVSAILFFVLSLVVCGFADAQLLMEKSRVEETVNPGETIADVITLHNNGEVPMDLTVYWEDFEYLPPYDGKKNFMPAGSSPFTMSNWIAFSPREVTIPPKGKRDINYTIKVPSDAVGGHYGVLFFESGSREKSQVTGVNIVTRLGALFFIESANKNKSAALNNINLKESTITGTFENKGNIIFFPKGIYYMMDKEGLVLERGEVDKLYVPPQKEAPFAIDLSDELKEGDYTLVLTFDLNEGDSVVKEVDLKKVSAGYEIKQVRD